MPVKPSTPATIETSKKISAHFRIVIAAPKLVPPVAALEPFWRTLTRAAGNWFLGVVGTCRRVERPLLIRFPAAKSGRDRSATGAATMTMSHSATIGAEAHAAPKAKARNLSLDRARTFLTLVVLLHHAVIPYTYFGHTDPSWSASTSSCSPPTASSWRCSSSCQDCSPGRASRARRRQSFSATACCGSGCRSRSRRSPSFRSPITQSRCGTIPAWASRILVEDDHGRPVAERPDLVRVGAAGVRPDREPALPGLAHLVDPVNRVSLRGFEQPAVFFAVCSSSSPPSLTCRRCSISAAANGSSSGRFRCRRAASCSTSPISSSASVLELRISIAASSAPTASCRNSAGCGCSPR